MVGKQVSDASQGDDFVEQKGMGEQEAVQQSPTSQSEEDKAEAVKQLAEELAEKATQLIENEAILEKPAISEEPKAIENSELAEQYAEDLLNALSAQQLKQLFGEATAKAMMMVSNQEKLLDVVRNHHQLGTAVIHALEKTNTALNIIARKSMTDPGTVETVTFKVGDSYSVKTLTMGLIELAARTSNVERQNNQLKIVSDTAASRAEELDRLVGEQKRQIKDLQEQVKNLTPYKEVTDRHPIFHMPEEDRLFVLTYENVPGRYVGVGSGTDKDDALKAEVDVDDYRRVSSLAKALKFPDATSAQAVIDLLLDKRKRAKSKRGRRRGITYEGPKNPHRLVVAEIVTRKV